MDKNKQHILVTGATGKQGGAVVRALQGQGVAVRALVRAPDSDAAMGLRQRGVEVVKGDLREPETLHSALDGVDAVFSVQSPDLADLHSDTEMVQGRNLVEAAVRAGVQQFVHSSVSGTGTYLENEPGWKEGRWDKHYWESKQYTEQLVRSAGFASWTLLKPAFFMENFIRPSFLFANWTSDELLTILQPATVLALIAVQDIGTAVAAAFLDPVRFNQVELELAGDRLPMRDIADTLAKQTGLPIVAPALTPDEAIAKGMMPLFVNGQQWLNEVGSPAQPENARSLGIEVTPFAVWSEANFR